MMVRHWCLVMVILVMLTVVMVAVVITSIFFLNIKLNYLYGFS